MLQHHLKTALRNLFKNKSYAFVNIFGLAVGMTAALVLAKYVGYTLTYDNFHKNKDRIYAVHNEEFSDGLPASMQNSTYWGVGYAADDLYPEITGVTRFTGNVETLVISKSDDMRSISFNENKLYTVDSSFLRVFTFPAVSGDVKTALSSPNAIVLTNSIAKKYFGDTDPIGQTLTTRVSWGAETPYKVTCVLEDPPPNSSLQFDFLLSGAAPQNYWHDPAYPTYLLLDGAADPDALEEKMSREIGGNAMFKAAEKSIQFKLMQLSDTSLSSSEWMLVMIGAFILLISWINFVNLSIGRALMRFKETGVRKVIGATRFQLIKQFILEALLVNGIALILTLIFFGLVKPFLVDFTNGHLLPLAGDPTSINTIFIITFFFGAIASSAYPAIVLSLSNPITALKGKFIQGKQSIRLRKTLVIAQFSVSVISTIGVFVIADQMRYMQNQDLKIDLDRTLIIKAPKDLWEGKAERLATFKAEAANFVMVDNATSSTTIPGMDYRHEVYFSLKDSEVRSLFYLNDIEVNFLTQYGVGFLAGENFSMDTYAKNKRGIMLNKTAALALGFTNFEDAIGEQITEHEDGQTYELIGIVEDYHQVSLKDKIKPQAFRFNQNRGDISIKINASHYSNSEDVQRCILALNALWNKVYKDQSFEYYFLDAGFNAQYHDDLKFGKLFGLFSALSVFIACLGLFGLSLFISLKRKKEVGIRKVFGASSSGILILLTKDYLLQIIVSVLIGAPIGYFLMENWLTGYSFRTSVNGWSLLLPCLFLTIISVGVIAFQTIRTSWLNPVRTLRDE